MSFGKIFTIRPRNSRINTESKKIYKLLPKIPWNTIARTCSNRPSNNPISVWSKTRASMWTCIPSTCSSSTFAKSWTTPNTRNVSMTIFGSCKIWTNSMISQSTRSSNIRPNIQTTSVICTPTLRISSEGRDPCSI